MSTPLFECVANVSVGRTPDEVTALEQRVLAVASGRATLLDIHTDPDHNRSVFTMAGEAEPLLAMAWALAEGAVATIDLNQHTGVHRRMGALDVCPFVPLSGADMAAAVALAERFGTRLAAELQVPVYFYARAARRRERRALGTIRNLQFEGLRDRIGTDPTLAPDIPAAGAAPSFHPTAGAAAVGARRFLVAYNVEFEGEDLALARRIAAAVRERDGGMPRVQALGLQLASRGTSQVSTNLLDFTVTGIRALFDRVRSLAAEGGIAIARSELVGLVPEDALDADLPGHVLLHGFDPDRQVIERLVAARLGG